MAFRIHDSVVRGEIDNREIGLVCGKIWLAGRAAPVVLKLKGNAWPDLAGCLLTFANTQKAIPDSLLESLDPLQSGTIGDLTASLKVRVFEMPQEDALEQIRRDEQPPEYFANCLYLEWFSDANGRVVIESADFELSISTPEWRLTREQDAERAKQAADGMNDYMNRLTEAVERHQRGQKAPEEPWDEHDYERFMKACDARSDKYAELLDKYGDSAVGEEKIAEEMGWHRAPDQAEDDRMSVEEIDAICGEEENEPLPEPDPEREGIDWIRTKRGDLRHPLQFRCAESAQKFWQQATALGLDHSTDADLAQFLFEFQTTDVKLAGALNPLARGENFTEGAFTVARLKRALDHLHKAQAGFQAVALKHLLAEAMVVEARTELFKIREAILHLMDVFRGRT